jgi:hypothetical protein
MAPKLFYGFRFAFILGDKDKPPWIEKLMYLDDIVCNEGDLVNLETGLLDIAATDDVAILGAVQESVAVVTPSDTLVETICDWDAVYAVYDASARLMGATLDLAGASGVMVIAETVSAPLVVIAPSAATELTYVMINPTACWLPF